MQAFVMFSTANHQRGRLSHLSCKLSTTVVLLTFSVLNYIINFKLSGHYIHTDSTFIFFEDYWVFDCAKTEIQDQVQNFSILSKSQITKSFK